MCNQSETSVMDGAIVRIQSPQNGGLMNTTIKDISPCNEGLAVRMPPNYQQTQNFGSLPRSMPTNPATRPSKPQHADFIEVAKRIK